MSGENYVTASKVIVMVKGIKSVTEKTMVRCNKAKEFGQKLIDCMHKSSRFLNIENSKTNASSSLLDPRFKLVTAIINVRKAESVVTDSGTTIPTSSPHTDETKDSYWDDFDDKATDLLPNPSKSATALATAEVDRYLNDAVLPRT